MEMSNVFTVVDQIFIPLHVTAKFTLVVIARFSSTPKIFQMPNQKGESEKWLKSPKADS